QVQFNVNYIPFAAKFYNNVVVPLSTDFANAGIALTAAAAAVSTLAAVVSTRNPPAAIELFQEQAWMLAQADLLGKAKQAQPFVDPPLVLRDVNPSGVLTSSMIWTFQQIAKNIPTEMELIAALTQLGSKIQVAVAGNQDATSLIENYI